MKQNDWHWEWACQYQEILQLPVKQKRMRAPQPQRNITFMFTQSAKCCNRFSRWRSASTNNPRSNIHVWLCRYLNSPHKQVVGPSCQPPAYQTFVTFRFSPFLGDSSHGLDMIKCLPHLRMSYPCHIHASWPSKIPRRHYQVLIWLWPPWDVSTTLCAQGLSIWRTKMFGLTRAV